MQKLVAAGLSLRVIISALRNLKGCGYHSTIHLRCKLSILQNSTLTTDVGGVSRRRRNWALETPPTKIDM